jgi:hypothetical protein
VRRHLAFEEATHAAAVGLGHVHRGVGVLDQLRRQPTVVRDHRDTDRRRYHDALPLHRDRRLDGQQHALHQLLDDAAVCHVGQQDHELVAAESAHQVDRAHRLHDAVCHCLQHGVAHQVAQ